MNRIHEPICPSCKAKADFRISNLPAGIVKKEDGDYKREIKNVLICNQCGAVICQIDFDGIREEIV